MTEVAEPLIHLLIPKEFKVYCVHRKPSPVMKFTMYPSKATCANCLTQYRHRDGFKKGKGRSAFKVSWTSRHNPHPGDPDSNKL